MPIHDIPYEEMKAIYVSPESRLTEDVARYLDDMLSLYSPRDYEDTLAEIYHMYILHEHKSLPPNFFDIASRMIVMMEFFKMCEKTGQLKQ